MELSREFYDDESSSSEQRIWPAAGKGREEHEQA
jgi:hypothetical protein